MTTYLGGADFDALIVEKLVVPQLEKRGQFSALLEQMKSATGRYYKLWLSLLYKAEEAKIELSTRTSAEIDLSRRGCFKTGLVCVVVGLVSIGQRSRSPRRAETPDVPKTKPWLRGLPD